MKKKAFSMLATAALATFIAVGSAEASTESYTVKTGDTLWKIASQHKLSVDELKSLNNLSSDTIKIDQKLTVSAKGSTLQKPTPIKGNPITSTNNNNAIGNKATSSTNSWENNMTIKVDKLSSSSEKVLLAAIDVSLPLLDTPYVWAGATVDGFDCSGFIYYVFSTAGLDIPRFDTLSMYSNSSYVDEPKPGDLLFFENTYRSGISHAGIYLGEGNFIHAGTKKVEISSIASGYWKDKFMGFKRFDLLN